jgi:ferredoxin/flavodoxin
MAMFSQTGTTLKIAEEIAIGLRAESGCELIFHMINSLPAPTLDEFDVIGIGSPVYIFRPPFPVIDFVKSLPDLKGKAFFVFVQYGTTPGDCGNWIRRELRRKHGQDAGYLLTRGPNYFISYVKHGYLFSPDSPTHFEIDTARRFGQLLVRRYASKISETETKDPRTHVVHAFERFTTNRLFVKMLLSRFFMANHHCDGCGICIQKCPVKNITPGVKMRPVWHTNCILCGTCQMVCPKDAVSSPFDWLIFDPFVAYNVSRARCEKTHFSRVSHAEGKTLRLE